MPYVVRSIYDSSPIKPIEAYIGLIRFIQRNPEAKWTEIRMENGEYFFANAAQLQKAKALIKANVPMLGGMRGGAVGEDEEVEQGQVVSEPQQQPSSLSNDLLYYLFILKALEDSFPILTPILDSWNDIVPQINTWLETILPILTAPLLAIGIGEVADVIFLLIKTSITFSTVVMNLSRREFKEAFLFFVALFPIVGAQAMKFIKTGEKVYHNFTKVQNTINDVESGNFENLLPDRLKGKFQKVTSLIDTAKSHIQNIQQNGLSLETATAMLPPSLKEQVDNVKSQATGLIQSKLPPDLQEKAKGALNMIQAARSGSLQDSVRSSLGNSLGTSLGSLGSLNNSLNSLSNLKSTLKSSPLASFSSLSSVPNLLPKVSPKEEPTKAAENDQSGSSRRKRVGVPRTPSLRKTKRRRTNKTKNGRRRSIKK